MIQVGFVMLLLSCKSEVNDDMITYENNKAYLTSTRKPYTGEVITKFNIGGVSSLFTYKDGLLNGRWYTKGYNDEIIQEGEYLDVKTVNIKPINGVDFNSLSLWKEGSNTFVTLDLVSKEKDIKLNDEQFELIIRDNLLSYEGMYFEVRLFDKDSLLNSYRKQVKKFNK